MSDLDAFFPTEGLITALDGSQIKFSTKIPWKKDVEIIRSVPLDHLNSILTELPTEADKIGPELIVNTIKKIIDTVPEILIQIVSKIIEKPIEWCENNLTFEDILSITIPFFAKYYIGWVKTKDQIVKPASDGT